MWLLMFQHTALPGLKAEQPACVWGIRHPLPLNLHLLSPICQHSEAAGGLAEAEEHPGLTQQHVLGWGHTDSSTKAP